MFKQELCHVHISELAEVDDGLGNRIGGFNRLGVSLVITLGNDQIHQFRRKIHVGLLDGTGLDRPQGSGIRCTDNGLAGLEGFNPGGFPDRRKSVSVVERCKGHLPQGLRLAIGVAGEQHALVGHIQARQPASGIPVLALVVYAKVAPVLGGIAKVQNDNEGGKFSDLVALIGLGLLAGAPLAGILFVSDFLSLLDQLKK